MQQQNSRAPLRVPARLGDYSVNPRIVMISALALAVGAVAAVVADGLHANSPASIDDLMVSTARMDNWSSV